jgi:Fe-S-cluster containining protein
MAQEQDPSPEQIGLYSDASQELFRKLRKAADAAAVLEALRWGMAELDRTFNATSDKVRAKVACRPGCDFCCRVPMGVQAHEVFLVAGYIQSHFSPEERAAVIARTAAHRERVAAMQPSDYPQLFEACALLKDGKCTVYESRPEVCRSHHSSNAQVCADYLQDPTIDLEKAYIPPLRGRMFAVMLGIDQGFAEAEFDTAAYDFGSALHEALTNELSLVRWSQKKQAFPEACREP